MLAPASDNKCSGTTSRSIEEDVDVATMFECETKPCKYDIGPKTNSEPIEGFSKYIH